MLNELKIFLLLFVLIADGYSVSKTPASSETSQLTPMLDGRIVGGREVSILKHPHQCSLRYRSCNQCAYRHLCGGSIYNEYTLITAAHCMRGRDAKNFMVVCGTENRSGADGVIVPVESSIMHEDYNPLITDNDVAVLFLSVPLPIDNVTVAAIALAEEHPKNGAKSHVSGWGTTTEGGFSSSKLLEVEVPIVSNDLCDEAYGGQRITDAMLCAGAVGGGKDACQGDSGGPLVVGRQLAGIVSWGRGCARPDFPGVYANVAYLKKWIEDAVLRNDLTKDKNSLRN